MKTKTFEWGALLVSSLLFLALPASPQEAPRKFSLVLSGGYGTMTGGDMSKLMDDTNAHIRDLAASLGFVVTDALQNANAGPRFEAEFLYRPTWNFGVSFGVGFLRKTEESRGAANLEALAAVSIDWTAAYSLIPLKLSGYGIFPVGSKMTIYAKAGVGHYIGRMTYTVRTEEMLLGIVQWEQNKGEAKASGFGFHGGLGLEYLVSSTLAIFIEAAGQYVQLNDWSADNTYSTIGWTETRSGKLWYAEKLDTDSGRYYAILDFSKDKPADAGLQNVREAALGFTGLAVKSGMKISF